MDENPLHLRPRYLRSGHAWHAKGRTALATPRLHQFQTCHSLVCRLGVTEKRKNVFTGLSNVSRNGVGWRGKRIIGWNKNIIQDKYNQSYSIFQYHSDLFLSFLFLSHLFVLFFHPIRSFSFLLFLSYPTFPFYFLIQFHLPFPHLFLFSILTSWSTFSFFSDLIPSFPSSSITFLPLLSRPHETSLTA